MLATGSQRKIGQVSGDQIFQSCKKHLETLMAGTESEISRNYTRINWLELPKLAESVSGKISSVLESFEANCSISDPQKCLPAKPTSNTLFKCIQSSIN